MANANPTLSSPASGNDLSLAGSIYTVTGTVTSPYRTDLGGLRVKMVHKNVRVDVPLVCCLGRFCGSF